MKQNINKKSQIDSIDSNTFLNNVLPSIKVNQKSYHLDEFGNTPTKEIPRSKKHSTKHT